MSHIVITGHSRGVGAALALHFLEKGFSVLGLSRKPNEILAEKYPALLREVSIDLSDVTALITWLKSDGLATFLAPATAAYLVNNAGCLQPVGPLGTQDHAAIAKSIAVNITAPFLLSDALIAASSPGIQRRILHISSGVGRHPCAGWSVYSATKAALDHHARSAALDAVNNLKIASIAPGVIDTDMQEEIRNSDPKKFPLLDQFHALKQNGQLDSPADCAHKLALFLLSDSFENGDIADVRDRK